MLRIILKLIVEIIIAVILFILLIRFTPLFGGNDEPAIDQPSTGSDDEIVYEQPTYTKPTITYSQYLKEKPSASTVKKKNCLTLGGDRVTHGQSVVRYQSRISNDNNVCIAQIRSCDNGRLLGSYTYETCAFQIEGTRGNTAVIAGAFDSRHTLDNIKKSYTADLVQPDKYRLPTSRYLYTRTGQRVGAYINGPRLRDNSTNMILPYTLDEVNPYPSLPTSSKSCKTPRGTSLSDGDYVAAYQTATPGVRNLCYMEMRGCNDGILQGSFVYKSCSKE